MTDETEQTPSIEIQTGISPRLQQAALLAEIISGIAIIVSLIFVGLQIQQNTKATRAASAFEVNRMKAQNTLGYSLDSNASLLNRKLFDPSTAIEEYTEEERARADMLILGTVQAHLATFRLY